jgi:hypothetical protein
MRIGSASICAAVLAISGVAVVAQSPAQSPAQPPAQSAAPSSIVSFVGCVQKESSVLKRNPVAANIGMEDEFVLTFAKPAPAPGTDEPKPEAKPETTATSGSPSNFGTVYRLTGDKEKELKSLVGQRVEISGSIKDKEKTTDALSSIGTSGKTELTPANTAEITIEAIRPASGSCAPAIK